MSIVHSGKARHSLGMDASLCLFSRTTRHDTTAHPRAAWLDGLVVQHLELPAGPSVVSQPSSDQ